MNQTQILERIAALMADVPAIAKTQRNKEQGYQFRGIDTIYNSLHDLMTKHKIFTTSQILDVQRNEWQSKSGGKLIEFALSVRWTFWTVDGSNIQTETMGQAMDAADKAANKAMTMSHKTALLQIFMIPTDDTPDADANTPEPMPRQMHSASQPETRQTETEQQPRQMQNASQPVYRTPETPQQQQNKTLEYIIGANGAPICPAHGWEMKRNQRGWYCSGRPKPGYPVSDNGQYCGCQVTDEELALKREVNDNTTAKRGYEVDDLPF